MSPVTQNLFRTFYKSGLPIVFLASIGLYFLEWRNQGINLLDFEVYYRSAARLLHGENLYRIASDDYFIFKYSPVSAFFYIPFTFFPLAVAKNIYWLFLTVIAASAFLIGFKLALPQWNTVSTGKKYLFYVMIILSIGVHLYREFALGQVNIVLFFSYLLVILFFQKEKPLAVALILAIGLFFKPWGLIFIPYFIIKKEFKIIIYFLIFSVVLFFLPVVFYGFQEAMEQTGKWFYEMAVEMRSKQNLGAFGNHTVFSVLYRYTPVHFLGNSAQIKLGFQLIVLFLLGVLVLVIIFKGREVERKEVTEGALLVGLMPLLAPAAYNTFLMLALAMIILMVNFGKLPLWLQILFILGLIIQGGNANDIWGSRISNSLIDLSVVAIGALAILACLVFGRIKKIV